MRAPRRCWRGSAPSQGQADAAATLIAAAVKAAGDTDYLPAYYQARLLLRGEGQHAGDDHRRSRRARRSCSWRASSPSSRRWPTRTASPPTPRWSPTIRRRRRPHAATAFTLSPRHEYALLHARARVFERDTAVRPALRALVERGSNDWIRREAQELLDFLAKVESLDWTPSVADHTGAPAGTAGGSTAPAGPARTDPGVPRRRGRRGARGRHLRGRRVSSRRA